MLLIANHVLGDVDRWWHNHRASFDHLEIGDLYRLLHRTAAEAEAAWSLLSTRKDGSRTFTVTTALLPITLQLFPYGPDLIVWDIRLHPTQPS
jgi:hypothetical protein